MMVLRSIVTHLCVQLSVVTSHLFDFMLLRDERDSEDVRVVKRAVTHTHHLMQRCNRSLHKTPALKIKKEHPYTEGPFYPSSRRDDTAKICAAQFVVFPEALNVIRELKFQRVI